MTPLAWLIVYKGRVVGYATSDTKDEVRLAECETLVPVVPAPPTSGAEWRCFHCDETFTDRDAAAVHFGTHEHQRPACLIDADEYRRMEAKEARYAEEDSDCHRAIHGMRNEHTQALQRAEEAGYAKGLRDSGQCPCTTQPRAAEHEGLTDAHRLHDYPVLLAFYQKHALWPLAAPSCLCCGQSTQGRAVAIRHLELPGIVICADCRLTQPAGDLEDAELPEMPKPCAHVMVLESDGQVLVHVWKETGEHYFTAEQMREYARAARRARGEG